MDLRDISDFPPDPRDYDAYYKTHKPNPFTEGIYFETHLERQQCSISELARQTGRVHSYIQQRLALIHAAEQIVALWSTGELIWTDARDICWKFADHDVQRELLTIVLARRAANTPLPTKEIKAIGRAIESGLKPIHA